MYRFVAHRLSRHFLIRHDYDAYEYRIYVYRPSIPDRFMTLPLVGSNKVFVEMP